MSAFGTHASDESFDLGVGRRAERGSADSFGGEPAELSREERADSADGPGEVRVLVVDDDPDHLRVVCDKLEYGGYDVTGVEDAEQALARLTRLNPAIVVTDLRLPGMDGLQLLERVRAGAEDVDVIVMTGHEDMSTAVAAMKGGAFDYLVKPIRLSELTDRLEACITERELRKQLEEESARPQEEPAGEGDLLVGRDPRMIEIYKTIGVLARNRATVLIRGETGTGKEMIARAIHETSAHADAPFLAVNCTALSDALLESELFGHVRGAFTGAVAGRKGYFEMAGTGTIFLDEIGDTSGEFQAKLLRVLQERIFYPVGSEKPLKTEARVVAATHRPIEELLRAGEFREDLYFRLKVVEVHVPPLRERRDDIPLLARHLLKRIREELDQEIHYISDGALETLLGYSWPGNVRELEHSLTRAAIVSRSGVIQPEHLVLETGEGEGGAATDGGTARAADGGAAASTDGGPAAGLGPGVAGKAGEAGREARGPGAPIPSGELRLDRVVADHIQTVLERARWDRSRAARWLGVSEEELDHLVEEHQIQVPSVG